jgi:hypothetical protein
MTNRSRSPFEESVLREILLADPKTAALLSQLSDIEVATLDDYGSLALMSRVPPTADRLSPLPSEGFGHDVDGIKINFIVFVRGEALSELQIYKDDGTPIQRLPTIDQIEALVLR